MTFKLLAAHHLEFQSLKGGCTGSSESALAKYHIVGNLMPRLKLHLPRIEVVFDTAGRVSPMMVRNTAIVRSTVKM